MNIYKLINPTIETIKKCYNNNFTLEQISDINYCIKDSLKQSCNVEYDTINHTITFYETKTDILCTINLISALYTHYYKSNDINKILYIKNLINNEYTFY